MNEERSVIVADDLNFMPIKAMKAQVQVIQQAMKEVMENGCHFGTIPGCGDKPTLLKPGAEKICLLFHLRTNFTVEERQLPGNHREYYVVCTLLNNGQVIGQGVGSASTMESKHRWRYAEPESTGIPVPKEYWAAKNNGDFEGMQNALGGRGFTAKKTDDGWMICKRTDTKVENPDIADVYNTCLKMAKKRAHVDATLTCTAASDIFTQDLEDIPPEQLQSKVAPTNGNGAKKPEPKAKPKKIARPAPELNKDECWMYDITAARKKVSTQKGKEILGKVFKANAGILEDNNEGGELQTVLYTITQIPEWEEFCIGEPVEKALADDDFPPEFDDLPGFDQEVA